MAECKSNIFSEVASRVTLIVTMGSLVFLLLDIGGLVLSGKEANRQYELRVDESMRKMRSHPAEEEIRSPEELDQLRQEGKKINNEIRYSLLQEYKLTLGIVLMVVFLGISIFRRRPHELVFGLAVVFLSLQFSLFSP